MGRESLCCDRQSAAPPSQHEGHELSGVDVLQDHKDSGAMEDPPRTDLSSMPSCDILKLLCISRPFSSTMSSNVSHSTYKNYPASSIRMFRSPSKDPYPMIWIEGKPADSRMD